jgi:hypothetical protein
MAVARPRDERLLAPVHEELESTEEAQAVALFSLELAHREDIVRTSGHAVFLTFAAITIDDRYDSAGLFAIWAIRHEQSLRHRRGVVV